MYFLISWIHLCMRTVFYLTLMWGQCLVSVIYDKVFNPVVYEIHVDYCHKHCINRIIYTWFLALSAHPYVLLNDRKPELGWFKPSIPVHSHSTWLYIFCWQLGTTESICSSFPQVVLLKAVDYVSSACLHTRDTLARFMSFSFFVGLSSLWWMIVSMLVRYI